MSDVFISYSKEDANTARLINDKLTAAGFSVWWDRRILPGKTWDEVIGSALDAASCVVVLWSRVSVQSRWVREEAERGIDRLVPILIEKVQPPLGFGRIEAADLSEWRGDASNPEFATVCDAIGGIVKKPRKVVAPPDPVPPVFTLPQTPQTPVLTPQFFVGRWRVEAVGGSDISYFPDGSFNGVITQSIGGFNMPRNVFGRWNLQVTGSNMFQLQIWFADMTSWAGTFQVRDVNHVQSMELGYVAARVR